MESIVFPDVGILLLSFTAGSLWLLFCSIVVAFTSFELSGGTPTIAGDGTMLLSSPIGLGNRRRRSKALWFHSSCGVIELSGSMSSAASYISILISIDRK